MNISRAGAALLVASSATASVAEPLALRNHRLFIGVRLNGLHTEALLDSAAEGSLVDPAFAAAARLPVGEAITIKGSGGTASARLVEGVEFEALGVVIRPDVLVITDLGDISRRLVGRPVRMVVGRELFDSARLAIDFRSKTIERLSPNSSPEGIELPLTRHSGVESIPVTANGVAAQAELDLGNGSEVLISREFAEKLYLKSLGTSVGGGIGGPLRRDIVVLNRLDVGGMSFQHVRAAVDLQPSANDLNVGTKILRNFRVTTDFAKRRVWLRRY